MTLQSELQDKALSKQPTKTKKEQLLELQAIRHRWPIPLSVKQEIINSAIEIASNSSGDIIDARARVNAMKILQEMESQNIEQEQRLIRNLQDDIEYEEEQEEIRYGQQDNSEFNSELNNFSVLDNEYDDALIYNKTAASRTNKIIPNSSSSEDIDNRTIQVNVQNNIVNPIFPEGLDLEAKKQYLLDKFNQK